MSPGRPRSASSGERTTPFPSFWIAAFDATDHLVPADDGAYRRRVAVDYRGVRNVGVECVHESIGWRRVERDGRFDFASVLMRAEAAQREGLRIVWSLCDAGWPDDVDVAAADFPLRLRRIATAAARALAPYAHDDAPVYVPVNEISFVSWALAETSLFGAPLRAAGGDAEAIKRQLVRAALAACDGILEVQPRARFLHREAALSTVPADAARLNVRFDAWDMLAGRLAPELGGNPRYLDIVGVHCHWSQQWRAATIVDSPVDSLRPGNSALVDLLEDVYARYRRPIVVSETHRIAAGRAQWLRDLGAALGAALGSGVPVIGAAVCRVVERPAWEDPRYWRERRLWDVLLDAGTTMPHAPDSAYDQALRDVRARIDSLVHRP